MKIKVIIKSEHQLRVYSTNASAGMDLRANLENEIISNPLERALVPTDMFIELPVVYEAQIRPGSGLDFKKGITGSNSPLMIGADYGARFVLFL